jgi:hypothetical protein
LRHYEVFSPEMLTTSFYEPSDPFRCWGVYLARSAKRARVLATQDKEFAEWVREARADRVPPFKGVTVRLARCEHGVCWACHSSATSTGCEACDAEIREREREDGMF